jgi:hypothetical protein
MHRWFYVMFPYGVYRQWTSSYGPPNDLIPYRVISSLFNGIYYCGPLGPVKLYHLCNRVNVWWDKKDPSPYIDSYREIDGTNMRVL